MPFLKINASQRLWRTKSWLLMRATLKLVTIFPLMNKILLVNESNVEVSNDLASNSRPVRYRCLIFPCLFLKVGQEKMAHGTDRGAANELSQRAKK